MGAPRQLVARTAVTCSAEATTHALVIGVRPMGLGRCGEGLAYQLIRARELLQTLGPLDLYLPPPLQLVHALTHEASPYYATKLDYLTTRLRYYYTMIYCVRESIVV